MQNQLFIDNEMITQDYKSNNNTLILSKTANNLNSDKE